MTENPINPPIAELAALYAAGVLRPAEMEAFEQRLLAGDPDCVREFELARPVADAFLKSAPSVEPRLIIRSDLINALGLRKEMPSFSREDQPADPFAEDQADMVLLLADRVDWKDTAVPGVQARNLWVDHANKRATVLLKLAPGVVYPDHDHPGVEECLVLEGDLELGGKIMGKHDYMRIPKGGQHGTPRTRNGCLLLVTTQLVDAA